MCVVRDGVGRAEDGRSIAAQGCMLDVQLLSLPAHFKCTMQPTSAHPPAAGADAISAQPVAKLGGYHRECVRDCSWHPYLPLLATGALRG